MIYLIIGGSCCGKTSFVKNTWLRSCSFEVKKDILPYTETSNALLLGKYSNIDGRERSGSDTISRSQICLIEEQIKKFQTQGKDIILEGDKITSKKIFDMLLPYKPKLILIHSSIEVSLGRNKQNDTIVKSSTLKAILTKAKNRFIEYKDSMNGISIDTSNFSVEDFKSFSLYNYKEYIEKYNRKKYQLNLFDL